MFQAEAGTPFDEEAIQAARDFGIIFGENTPQSVIDLFTGVA